MKFNILLSAVLIGVGGTSVSHACFFPNFYKEQVMEDGVMKQQYDKHKRTLQDIWSFDYDQLERTHNYIQTLFPCTGKGVDNDTPAITQEEINVFLRRPELRDKVFKSFKLMAEFYGFEIVPGLATKYIIPGPNFKKKTRLWARYNVHNHSRITRILNSLKLLGLPKVSIEFYQALVEYVPHNYIPDETWTSWKEQAGI